MKISITIECTHSEIKDFFEGKIASDVIKDFSSPKNKFIYYKDNPSSKIMLDDEIEILPSENCVTNSDKIKYDERISGEKGFVNGINTIEGTVLIRPKNVTSSIFIVPSHWLKLITTRCYNT